MQHGGTNVHPSGLALEKRRVKHSLRMLRGKRQSGDLCANDVSFYGVWFPISSLSCGVKEGQLPLPPNTSRSRCTRSVPVVSGERAVAVNGDV